LVGRDVDAFASAYHEYFAQNRSRLEDVTELDPAPRVIYDQELGLLTVGNSVSALTAARDIAMHTADIVEAADRGSGYQSLAEPETFDVEYWSLEQAKLRKAAPLPLEGEIVCVLGADRPLGQQVAQGLLDAGAVVCGVAVTQPPASEPAHKNWRWLEAEVENPTSLRQAFSEMVRDLGGLDALVIALPGSQDLTAEQGNEVLATARPYLEHSPRGPRVVDIGGANSSLVQPTVPAMSRLSVHVETDSDDVWPGVARQVVAFVTHAIPCVHSRIMDPDDVS